ncbi:MULTISPECIES: biopolymer transporter ExbD [Porphyromonas]
MMAKRKTPGINGSSSADIAFMLLIFFLVTTSMGSDKGILRSLPPALPPDQKDIELDINRRNMLKVLVNTDGRVLCNGEEIELSRLGEKVKEFVLNVNDDPTLPEREDKEIPLLGVMKVTKSHVISVTNNVDTKYADYITVQNILVRAYNELRADFARNKWGKTLEELSPEQLDALVELYPQKISEANPKEYGGKKK